MGNLTGRRLTGKRGWWWSPNSRKAHFFVEEEGGRAICGGFLVFATAILFAEASDTFHQSPDNCAACKRKRETMVKRGVLPKDGKGASHV